jgi:pimeloyl-ACP methyl ester carboxylesterase
MEDVAVFTTFLEDALLSSPSPLPTPDPPANLIRRGNGPAVLLLHGWGASNKLFEPVIAGLEHAFTLISPDFPGFGATAAPPSAWSVQDYAAWVITLLDSLGIEKVSVVGHSFGGRVGIMMAAKWPQRVSKLVLADSAGMPPRHTIAYHTRVRTFKLLRRCANSPIVPGLARQWAQGQSQRFGSSDYQRATGTVRESFVRVVNEDLREFLPRIKAPTLLVWGDRDEDTPIADAHVMEKLIPDAGLVVFQGAGHYAYLERSAHFCRIVETFLRGTQ